MKFELHNLESLIYEKEMDSNYPNCEAKKETNRITTIWQKIAIQQSVPMAKKYFQQH